ncbi:MAG: starvation-sensing protein RspA [Oscillospiraceae bacterium]|jgi:mannonate dehydratase|nr:starvation-sensing protein RspA [Oscillospiraceae bacterium]
MIKITDIRATITCPDDMNIIVVRVDTNQPGLYGLGCATYAQRCWAVAADIEKHIRPLLIGRDPRNIQDLWQMMHVNGYWRNGPVVNSALGGIDMALWDIQGKLAGMPVYQLLGGKCREAAAVYRYAAGADKEAVLEQAQRWWSEGYHYIRCQILPKYCSPESTLWRTEHPNDGFHCDPLKYLRTNVQMFEYIREKMGFDVQLLHDAHERLLPSDALRFAKELEPIRLFFLEDLFSPEQGESLRRLRVQCATPIAQGELFVGPNDWLHLVKDRLIDFMRVHPSMIGGISAAIRCAHVCEAFGVRMAWHGPIDMSPIGHAAQMHMDLAITNFGVQEWPGMNDAMRDVFPGTPELRNGYGYVNNEPGFGVGFNEAAARKYPYREVDWLWTQYRNQDSTMLWP